MNADGRVWNPMSQQYDPPPLTLAEFLLARIADDEGDAWRVHRDDCEALPPPAGYNGPFPCDCGIHVRILAECTAKRGVLDLLSLAEDQFRKTHLGAADYADVARARITRDALTRAVLHLAAPYAGHPDWREEWRP